VLTLGRAAGAPASRTGAAASGANALTLPHSVRPQFLGGTSVDRSERRPDPPRDAFCAVSPVVGSVIPPGRGPREHCRARMAWSAPVLECPWRATRTRMRACIAAVHDARRGLASLPPCEMPTSSSKPCPLGAQHYNQGRLHMALGPEVPDPPIAPTARPTARHRRGEPYVADPILGGLHHEYTLAAA
jgi:hypothetical protein